MAIKTPGSSATMRVAGSQVASYSAVGLATGYDLVFLMAVVIAIAIALLSVLLPRHAEKSVG